MLHRLGSKRKWKQPPKIPQDKLKKILPRFSCSIYISVCVHLFSPMLVNFVSFQFLSLGTVGIRDSVLRLMKCVPKGIEPLQPPGNHPNTEVSAVLRKEIRFWFLKLIGI